MIDNGDFAELMIRLQGSNPTDPNFGFLLGLAISAASTSEYRKGAVEYVMKKHFGGSNGQR